jgi:hypothetical protein
MNYSRAIRWGLLISLLFPASLALSDWVAKDASGLNVLFDAVTNGGKQIPKNVLSDQVGAQVGVPTNPLSVGVSQGGNTAVVSGSGGLRTDSVQSGTWSVGIGSALPTGSNTIGGVTQSSGPWSMNLSQVGGSTLSSTNPLPAQLSISNAAVATGNPLPMNCINGCSSSDSALATYSIGTSFVSNGSPSDIFVLQGSATKIVKIRRIYITQSNATASNSELTFVRRSSADSGGIPATITPGKLDPNDAGATAVATTYTGIPSTGTLVATHRDVAFVASTDNSFVPSQLYEFGGLGSKAFVLRGSSDFFAISGGAGNSNTRLTVEWTEE